MRRALVIALVVAQLGTLAYMAAEREWVLRTGRTMYLRTAPIDPRDPMRGDYVRLNYEIGHAPARLWRDGIAGWASGQWREQRAARDRQVYAQVQLDDDNVAQLVTVSDHEPASGLYLRGRVSAIDPMGVDLRYGVEALFMEQGNAKAFEQSRTARAGVPLNVEVAVGGHGLAVLKGYRWEPLGITLTFDREAAPPSQPRVPPPRQPRPIRAVTVELKNHSDDPVAIVALPGGRSFRLLPNERWREVPYRWVNETAAAPQPAAGDVRVLKPGESYRERIDFTSPQWWVREVRKGAREPSPAPIPWDKLATDWGASFRIEYAPPTKAASAGLPQAELIRHTRLRSRAFGAGGMTD